VCLAAEANEEGGIVVSGETVGVLGQHGIDRHASVSAALALAHNTFCHDEHVDIRSERGVIAPSV
jgi:hypothetical protein